MKGNSMKQMRIFWLVLVIPPPPGSFLRESSVFCAKLRGDLKPKIPHWTEMSQ